MGGEKKAMKKGLTMLVAAMVILGLICVIGSAAAADVVMGRSFSAEGTGIINLELGVATEQWNSGLTLDERMSTPGGGLNGNGHTYMKYSSAFALDRYNVTNNATDNSTTELEYSSDAKVANAKRTVYTKNYVLGAVMGFKNEGYSNQEINMYSEDTIMEVEISGVNIGNLILFEKVVDVINTHAVLVYDVSELQGEFSYNWTAYLEEEHYPAGDVAPDWLGCP